MLTTIINNFLGLLIKLMVYYKGVYYENTMLKKIELSDIFFIFRLAL